MQTVRGLGVVRAVLDTVPQTAGDYDMSNEQELREANPAKQDLANGEQLHFDVQFATRRKDPRTALAISIIGGSLGVDRFYIGDIGLGIAKLLTLGGLFIWTIIDWFLIMDAARLNNSELMRQVRESIVQSRA